MTSDRYHRQELIPDWKQENISNARVLILGIGATGSFVATNLILSGVGELILVDFEVTRTPTPSTNLSPRTLKILKLNSASFPLFQAVIQMASALKIPKP